jgi:hypothetical protein
VLIHELAAALGRPDLPPFDARRIADLYRAQPRDRRRAVNALVRSGGTLPVPELLARTGSSPEALAALEQAGLLRRLGDDAVLPLEHLFAVPLLENDPDKLVEALKIFPKDALWTVAVSAGVAVDGADEAAIRARLYRHALRRGRPGFTPAELRILRRLQERDWSDDYQGLERWAGRGWVAARCSVDGLLGETSPALRSLALGLWVTPVRLEPGSPIFLRVGVPRELRASILEALDGRKARPAGCSDPTPPKWLTIDTSLRADLLRYLLLIEQDPPSTTRKGSVNQRDLARMAKRAGLSPERVELANGEACDFRLLSVEKGKVGVGPLADRLFAGGGAAFGRNVLEARRELWTGFGHVWAPDEDAVAEISDEVMALLRKDFGAAFCSHCLARELRERKGFAKRVKEGDRARVAASAVQGHLRLLFRAGAVAVVAEGDEIRRAKWTPEGVEIAKPAARPEPAPPPRTLVQPSGEIIAPGELPFSELRAIAAWAEVKSVDPAAVFSLTRASALRAAQRGGDPAAFRALLERLSGGALPQPVAFHLGELADRRGEVELLPCSALVRARDPLVLKGLEGVREIAPGLALVPAGADPEELAARLRKQGFLLAAPEAAVPAARLALEKLFREAADYGGIVEVVLRGGRRHTLFVDSLRDGTVTGDEFPTNRRLSISLDAVDDAWSATGERRR